MRPFARLLMTTGILLTLAISTAICVAAPSEQPGGKTPAAVLTRAGAAIRTGNIEEFARCNSAYVRDNPDTARGYAGMLRLRKDVQPIIVDGVKKYGAANFAKALGIGSSCLNQGVAIPPYDLIAKKGKLAINGNTAKYTYTVSMSDVRHLNLRPEVIQFLLSTSGNNVKNISVDLVKINGRWFLNSPDRTRITAYRKLYQPMTVYLQQVRKCIASSANVQKFTTAIAGPNDKLKKSVTEAFKSRK